MKKLTIFPLLGFILLSCSDSLTNYNEVKIGVEFSLKKGESAIVPERGLEIKFKTVSEDSRCPIGLLCFWAGNATVVLKLKDSKGSKETAELKTYLDPKYIEYSDLIITLKDLTPYPKYDEIINPDDYVAKLIVKTK